MDKPHFNESGSKYLRSIKEFLVNGFCDVYAVLLAFDVRCPARQHAIKKLLCSGIRGKGNAVQDLQEARDAIDRAIQIEQGKQGMSVPTHDMKNCNETDCPECVAIIQAEIEQSKQGLSESNKPNIEGLAKYIGCDPSDIV